MVHSGPWHVAGQLPEELRRVLPMVGRLEAQWVQSSKQQAASNKRQARLDKLQAVR